MRSVSYYIALESPKPFGFEPLSDDLHDLFVMDELLKSPQPFGFESLSDSRKTISSISAFPGHQSLSASSPCRTQIFKSVCQQIGAFMSPQPFGFEPLSDKPTGGIIKHNIVAVATAFRLRALVGRWVAHSIQLPSRNGRQSLSASSPCRTYVDWGNISNYQELSPKPFGFESLSDPV